MTSSPARFVPGPRPVQYRLVAAIKGAGIGAGATSLFDGLSDPLVDTFASIGEAGHRLREIRDRFLAWAWDPPQDLKQVAHMALEAIRLCQALLQRQNLHPELRRQLDRFATHCQKVVGIALGIDLAVHHTDRRVAPGDTLRSQLLIWNHGPEKVELLEARMDVPGTSDSASAPLQVIRRGFQQQEGRPSTLLPGNMSAIEFALPIPSAVHFTEPETTYVYRQFRSEPNCHARVRLRWQEQEFTLSLPAPVAIAPPLQLEPELPGRIYIAGSDDSIRISMVIRNNGQKPGRGTVLLRDESGEPLGQQPFALPREDAFQALQFVIPNPSNRLRRLLAEARVAPDGRRVAETAILLKPVTVQVPQGVRVGVIQSYDVTLMQALRQLGISASPLNRETLLWGDFSKLDVIFVDIRAYLVRDDLRSANERLLEWVRQGGRLVVMYHKVFEWNPEYGNPLFAPYPLRLGRQRVTDETAEVKVLLPEHPLLNVPNKIQPDDWDGWVQERGLYFPAEAAPEYARLLSMHDPGEEPLDTSLLYARYGRGEYIYTSLVWYRQLRALVPGAFRMLANFVAWKKP